MTAPCKDCKDRMMGFHGKCKRYADYTKERDKIRQKRKIDAAVQTIIKRHMTQTMKRTIWQK